MRDPTAPALDRLAPQASAAGALRFGVLVGLMVTAEQPEMAGLLRQRLRDYYDALAQAVADTQEPLPAIVLPDAAWLAAGLGAQMRRLALRAAEDIIHGLADPWTCG